MIRSTLRERRSTHRTGFSLVELLVVLSLSIVLLAGYVRALDESEAVEAALRDDTLPRLARGRPSQQMLSDLSGGGAATPAVIESEVPAAAEDAQVGNALPTDAQAVSAEGLTATPDGPPER